MSAGTLSHLYPRRISSKARADADFRATAEETLLPDRVRVAANEGLPPNDGHERRDARFEPQKGAERDRDRWTRLRTRPRERPDLDGREVGIVHEHLKETDVTRSTPGEHARPRKRLH